MTAKLNGQTDNILEFRAKVWSPLSGRLDAPKSAVPLSPPRLVKTVIGDGWYHDAAILEADQPLKR